MAKTNFHTLFNPPPSEALNVPESDMCVETGHSKECDINLIVASFNRGDLSALQGTNRTPVYGDFSNVKSFDDAKQAVIDGERAFMSLDPWIRKRFDNDPAKLLAFLEDGNNLDEAIQLGLCKAPEGYRTPEQRAMDAEEAKIKADKAARMAVEQKQ